MTVKPDEIKFKQSDVMAVIGMSESTIIRYRKKKVFTPSFVESKYGKTYMINETGIKAILNEWNLGRTVDVMTFEETMERLFERAGLGDYRLNTESNTPRPQVDNTINTPQQPIKNSFNTARQANDNTMNETRQPIDNNINTQKQPFDNSMDNVIEGEYREVNSEDSQPNNQGVGINSVEVVDKFIDELSKRENKILELTKEIERLKSENKYQLESADAKEKRIENERKALEEKYINQKAYIKAKDEWDKLPLYKKILGKKPNRKDYGLED